MLPNLSSNFITPSTRRESGEFVFPYLELAWDTKVSRKVPSPSGFLRVAKENKMAILVPSNNKGLLLVYTTCPPQVGRGTLIIVITETWPDRGATALSCHHLHLSFQIAMAGKRAPRITGPWSSTLWPRNDT